MITDVLKRGRLITLFLLGMVLFNYPILSLFNRSALLFGIPVLYLFLFLMWLAFIGLIAHFSGTPRSLHSQAKRPS